MGREDAHTLTWVEEIHLHVRCRDTQIMSVSDSQSLDKRAPCIKMFSADLLWQSPVAMRLTGSLCGTSVKHGHNPKWTHVLKQAIQSVLIYLSLYGWLHCS